MRLFLKRRRAFRHERSSVQQFVSRLRAKQPRREAAGSAASSAAGSYYCERAYFCAQMGTKPRAGSRASSYSKQLPTGEQ